MQPPEREIGMLKKHRDHIRNNLDRLVKMTDYDRISMECVRQGILSATMLRNAEDLNGQSFSMDEEDVRLQQHRNFFLKIIQRGPTAYNQLIIALRKVDKAEAAELLVSVDDSAAREPFISISKSKASSRSADIVDTKCKPGEDGIGFSKKPLGDPLAPLTPFTEPVEGTLKVIKSTKIHVDKLLGTYPMVSRDNRGVLFMVNNIDFPNSDRRRNGADIDSNLLIHIFRQMGFTIFPYNNLTQQEFFDYLHRVTSSTYAKKTECFVMVLMTHGNRVEEIDKVEFHDGSVANTQTIKNHFHANMSPNLVGKPKVLIFPFCRGEKEDKGQPNYNESDSIASSSVPMQPQVRVVETDGMPGITVPTCSDTLVCYGNIPGYVTYRQPKIGSWYIKTLCEMLAEHAHDTHFEDILKKVHNAVLEMRTDKDGMQTGNYENIGFNKKLYFNPGFFLG